MVRVPRRSVVYAETRQIPIGRRKNHIAGTDALDKPEQRIGVQQMLDASALITRSTFSGTGPLKSLTAHFRRGWWRLRASQVSPTSIPTVSRSLKYFSSL